MANQVEVKVEGKEFTDDNVTVFTLSLDNDLWSRMKAQCLDTNPFISFDDQGREVVKCPRCMREQLSMEYTTFNIEPVAVLWACSVQKCPHCHHIFAMVR